MFLILDKLLYSIFQYVVYLAILGVIIFCILYAGHMLDWFNHEVQKYVYITLLLEIFIGVLLFVTVGLDMKKYSQREICTVEDYRIQKMKEKSIDKTYYLLKTDKGTKIVDEWNLQVIEEDKFPDKKHLAGTKIMTYSENKLKDNVPKYKRKVLEDNLDKKLEFKKIIYKSNKVH